MLCRNPAEILSFGQRGVPVSCEFLRFFLTDRPSPTPTTPKIPQEDLQSAAQFGILLR
jgi:hypothetical protein